MCLPSVSFRKAVDKSEIHSGAKDPLETLMGEREFADVSRAGTIIFRVLVYQSD